MKVHLTPLQVDIIIQLLNDKHDIYKHLGNMKAARVMFHIRCVFTTAREKHFESSKK